MKKLTKQQKETFKEIAGQKYKKDMKNPFYADNYGNGKFKDDSFNCEFKIKKNGILKMTFSHRMTSETVYKVRPNGKKIDIWNGEKE